MADYCPITAHHIVKQYNKPDYLGPRLNVDSQLNLVEWKKELVGYWDTLLIDLMSLLSIRFQTEFVSEVDWVESQVCN